MKNNRATIPHSQPPANMTDASTHTPLLSPEYLRADNLIQAAICAEVKAQDQHAFFINCGNCDLFAHIVADKLKAQGVEVETRENTRAGHVWFFCPQTGRHYDVEEPQGVTNAYDLPYFVRVKRETPNLIVDKVTDTQA